MFFIIRPVNGRPVGGHVRGERSIAECCIDDTVPDVAWEVEGGSVKCVLL